MEDHLNPKYAFCLLPTKLIVQFIQKQIDANLYLRRELVNRGLDMNGNWIGFQKAENELLTYKK